MQQKKGWLGGHFPELRFAGSVVRKPRQEFEGSALELFFHVVLRLNGASIVVKIQHKSQCKHMTFVRENQIIHWQGVYFYQLCFTKL